MSRTFKDKPYRVLEREALEHGYAYLRHNWMHPTEPPTLEGDVTAYAYSQSRKAHIPSGRRWHSWLDILPRMNAGDSRILRFGFLFATTKQERRGR